MSVTDTVPSEPLIAVVPEAALVRPAVPAEVTDNEPLVSEKVVAVSPAAADAGPATPTTSAVAAAPSRRGVRSFMVCPSGGRSAWPVGSPLSR